MAVHSLNQRGESHQVLQQSVTLGPQAEPIVVKLHSVRLEVGRARRPRKPVHRLQRQDLRQSGKEDQLQPSGDLAQVKLQVLTVFQDEWAEDAEKLLVHLLDLELIGQDVLRVTQQVQSIASESRVADEELAGKL